MGHFRKNISVLAAAGYKVYALDLLGFGGSDKPPLGWTQTGYEMEGWSTQIQAFLDEFVEGPAVLVGNSIGSLAALMVRARGGRAGGREGGWALGRGAGPRALA